MVDRRVKKEQFGRARTCNAQGERQFRYRLTLCGIDLILGQGRVWRLQLLD